MIEMKRISWTEMKLRYESGWANDVSQQQWRKAAEQV